MSKRKTGELRRKQADQKQYNHRKQNNTYYIDESKTIDFNQVKTTRKPINLVPQSINQEKLHKEQIFIILILMLENMR